MKAISQPWRALRRLSRLLARLDDSLIGDAIGVAALFALLWVGLLAGSVLGV